LVINEILVEAAGVFRIRRVYCARRSHDIRNDAELEAYTNALFQLTALESPLPSEVEAIELLTLLVERYEQEHYSIPAADPASVVRFLIEQQNLTQRDLIPQFGSESAVSMFLARPKDTSTSDLF
jgi:HTH-type transcriptional regulator/antitoxin HigA